MDRLQWTIKQSRIDGHGVFVRRLTASGSTIDVGIIVVNHRPEITQFGGLINHSYEPTATLRKRDCVYDVVALADLPALCEITINYNNTPNFIKNAEPHYQ